MKCYVQKLHQNETIVDYVKINFDLTLTLQHFSNCKRESTFKGVDFSHKNNFLSV